MVWVVDEAYGEDYAKLAGLSSEEELNEPLKKSMGKRLPWLLVLLGLSILVSTVIGSFEKVISSLTIVMFFQSMILDMAGNVGTQSLAVTIRVLMDENLTGSQKARFIVKELRIGFANGVILAVASGPLITTLNDLVGVVTYYSMAWLLLIKVLHI